MTTLKNAMRSVKPYIMGFLLGALLMALLLDNRAGAMFKAFLNPVAVNGMTLQTEVVSK